MKLQRKSNKQIITLNDSLILGAGGEARVYELPDDDKLVAKVYHKPTDERARKLSVMFENPPDDPMIKHGHVSIAWPLDLLSQLDGNRQIVGFLMPRVTNMLPVIDFYNPRTRRQKCPLFNYFYLHRTAYNLASAIRAIHERGYVIGDINESNVLVADTALVTLIDTDSFQVPDPKNRVVYRCPVGKPDFTPPEIQGKNFADIERSYEHDLFGMAVIIFQLLMEGMHPFAGIFKGEGDPPTYEERISSGHFLYSRWIKRRVPYNPMPAAPSFKILSPSLRKLFVKCFVKGHRKPQKRPTACEWQLALEKAENALYTCSINEQHRYGKHLRKCPWCERTQMLDGRDPFPSALSVQKPLSSASALSKSKSHVQKSFRLRNGKKANNLSELVTIIDSKWEDGKYHLYQGDIANWLKSIGKKEIARKAQKIVSSESDKDIGLEKFLQSLGNDSPTNPELEVNRTELNFGKVDIEQVQKGKYVKKIKIINVSRGHLYGTIKSSESWLDLDINEFSNNSVTVKARTVSPGSKANIIIASNGGTVTIPVTINPIYKWFKTVLITSLIGIIAAPSFRLSAALALWVINKDIWSWLSNSYLDLKKLLVSWYNIENILNQKFIIVSAVLTVPLTLAILSGWLWRIIRRKLDIKTSLFMTVFVWFTVVFIVMLLILPLFLVIAWCIDFAIQPSFNFISDISIYGWSISGLLIASAIGLLKWLKKKQKPLMYPVVIASLIAVFFLFRLVGIIISAMSTF